MAWIRNTSPYPDDEVRELIEFATRGVNMNRVCVNVKGGRSWGGHAYSEIPSISNAPPTAKYLVTLKLGETEFPFGPRNYNGVKPEDAGPSNRFPFIEIRCWRELLVHLAAHESKHIDQYRRGSRRSEVACEKFAARALDRFRERAQVA